MNKIQEALALHTVCWGVQLNLLKAVIEEIGELRDKQLETKCHWPDDVEYQEWYLRALSKIKQLLEDSIK
jgi:hypothetical protein